MNASQLHLALTHLPVILSFVGLVILATALIRKNDILTKTALAIFLAAGLFALPVYFTGEGAEETVEDLPGVSHALIEQHEYFAGLSMIIVLIAAALSAACLFLYKYIRTAKLISYSILIVATGSALAMGQTAHLGGQIRHSEIRAAFSTASDPVNQDSEPAAKVLKAKENDD